MLVFTHKLTERCYYTFQLVFNELLGLAYTVTTDPSHYHSFAGEKLAYTDSPPGSGFFLEAVPLLFETTITTQYPAVFPFAGTRALFPTSKSLFPFDVLAASFYLVSRYEEYLPFEPDQYGRFPGNKSLAYQHGFLDVPVVNCWTQELKKSLLHFYPSLHFQTTPFRSTISFDIDVAYAYKGRPGWWSAGALLKDLVFLRKTFLTRLRVILGRKKDPYDTYSDLDNMLTGYPADILFFFLLASQSTRYDRNLSPHSTCLRQLIRHCHAKGEIGIHPSYYSIDDGDLLKEEKGRLEQISGQTIHRSRQHYLRFRLPDTYLQLAEAGITDEYSMGYAELPGFRAGICTSFYFFDLISNRATTLRVHPITYMEGTFIEDLQLRPEASLTIIKQLISRVKQVEGHFLCIWHNHTISEWGVYKEWRQVFEETLRLVYEA
ncbi:MAG: polysaccharide deacetylase family protein [Williamsia sp.]|nr:polysaccharide deacetylase family protein [Williamsia sp.]